MSAPSHSDYDLSRREEMSVSGAVISGAPWGAATVTGGVVAAGDLGLHLIGASLGMGAVGGSLAMGAVAFFVVAAAGALWRGRVGGATRVAREAPRAFSLPPPVP